MRMDTRSSSLKGPGRSVCPFSPLARHFDLDQALQSRSTRGHSSSASASICGVWTPIHTPFLHSPTDDYLPHLFHRSTSSAHSPSITFRLWSWLNSFKLPEWLT